MHKTLHTHFARAFPTVCADAARSSVDRLALLGARAHEQVFEVSVSRETVRIPYRIYLGPLGATGLAPTPFTQALLTRDADGHRRERAVASLIGVNAPWVMPFLVQLMGEYVVEILDLIEARFAEIDPVLLADFANENPDFIALTRQRVMSYWNCYYSQIPKADYVGFRLMKRLT